MATSGTSGASSIFTAILSPANGSGVQGVATVILDGSTLTVTVDATGLQPGQHPIDIHGFANGAPSTLAQPIEGYDQPGMISGLVAHQAEGPAIFDLSDPQSGVHVLGAQSLIPTADANGVLHYSQAFDFSSTAQAQATLAALEPLGSRAIEINGLPQPITDLGGLSPAVGDTLPVVAAGLFVAVDHTPLG